MYQTLFQAPFFKKKVAKSAGFIWFFTFSRILAFWQFKHVSYSGCSEKKVKRYLVQVFWTISAITGSSYRRHINNIYKREDEGKKSQQKTKNDDSWFQDL